MSDANQKIRCTSDDRCPDGKTVCDYMHELQLSRNARIEALTAELAQVRAERDGFLERLDDARTQSYRQGLDDAAVVASNAHLHGSLKCPPSEWDKGYNHACTNITQRIRQLKGQHHD